MIGAALRRVGRGLQWLISRPVWFIAPVPLPEEAPQPHVSYDSLGLAVLYVALVLFGLRMPPMGELSGLVFWNGLPALFFPVAIRAAWPNIARLERWFLVVLLAEAAFAIKLLYAPDAFVHFDEFLHWLTAADMLKSHRLFLSNPLLPISPLFPGLELVTTALMTLSGCSLFVAATTLLITARALFISALFALYEGLTGSARLAALACLTYMGVSTYLLFDSQFAYESLALALSVAVLWAEDYLARRGASLPVTMLVGLPLLLGLAVTHHLTSYFTAAMLGGIAVVQVLTGPRRALPALCLAILAWLSIVSWAKYIGNPVGDYLGPALNGGAAEFSQLLGKLLGHSQTGGSPRQLFVSEDGTTTPFYLQVESLSQVGLTAALLAFGFFSALAGASGKAPTWRNLFSLLKLGWSKPRLLVFVMLALCWPLSIVMRLTSASWEMGNRLGTFAYIGVGLVTAVALLRVWRRPRQWWAAGLSGALLSLFFVGGAISGWGIAAVRTGYKVEADPLSIEPMGIDAAEWTQNWLGPMNRFTADRVNRLLLSTYGKQYTPTGLYDGYVTADLYGPRIAQEQLDEIRKARIDYILVDMRLTTAKPKLGNYFEAGEGELHDRPLNPAWLLKYDHIPGVSRVFDDGWIRIYEVRQLQRVGLAQIFGGESGP